MRDALASQAETIAWLRLRLFLLEQTSHQYFADHPYNEWFYSQSGAVAAYKAMRPEAESLPSHFSEPKRPSADEAPPLTERYTGEI